MSETLNIARKEAEISFLKNQKEFPLIYSEHFKPVFINCFIEAYLLASSNTLNKVTNTIDSLTEFMQSEKA